MRTTILTDKEGNARAIRSDCIQPSMKVGGGIEDLNKGHTAYTSVMETYEKTNQYH